MAFIDLSPGLRYAKQRLFTAFCLDQIEKGDKPNCDEDENNGLRHISVSNNERSPNHCQGKTN
jgi:hypothetical protein